MITEQKLNEELAYALSKKAHHGQKYGERDYFEYHVLGVASKFNGKHDFNADDECVKCGASMFVNENCIPCDHEAYMASLLHDVVEDSAVALETINNLFGLAIANAVMYLTNDFGSGHSYLSKYIPTVGRNPSAKKVKIVDLEFHLSQPAKKNQAKYEKALAYLKAVK